MGYGGLSEAAVATANQCNVVGRLKPNHAEIIIFFSGKLHYIGVFVPIVCMSWSYNSYGLMQMINNDGND